MNQTYIELTNADRSSSPSKKQPKQCLTPNSAFLVFEISSDDAKSIGEELAKIDDQRFTTNRKHLLGDIIAISIMAVIAGADGLVAIETWAMENKSGWREISKSPTAFHFTSQSQDCLPLSGLNFLRTVFVLDQTSHI